MHDMESPFITAFTRLQSKFQSNYPDIDVLDLLQLVTPVFDAFVASSVYVAMARPETVFYQNVPKSIGFTEESLGLRHVFETGQVYQASHLAQACTFQVTAWPLRNGKGEIVGALSIVDGSQRTVAILGAAISNFAGTLQHHQYSVTILSEFVRVYEYEFAANLVRDTAGPFNDEEVPSSFRDDVLEMASKVEASEVGLSRPTRSNTGTWLRGIRIDPNHIVVFGKQAQMTDVELSVQDGLAQMIALHSGMSGHKPGVTATADKNVDMTWNVREAFQFARHYARMLASIDLTSPGASDMIVSGRRIADGLRFLDRYAVGSPSSIDSIVRELATFYSNKGSPKLSAIPSIDRTMAILADIEDVVLAVQLVIRTVNPNKISIQYKRHGDFVTLRFGLDRRVKEEALVPATWILDLWNINLFSTEDGFALTAELYVSPDARSVKGVNRGKLSVLVVDDDDSLRDLLVDILKSRELTVYSCGEVPEAITLMDEKKPDIVISDYGLPRQSGAELARMVKTKSAFTPFILITGWGSDLNLTVDEQQSINYVLSKPFNLQEVLETFDRCIQSIVAPS